MHHSQSVVGEPALTRQEAAVVRRYTFQLLAAMVVYAAALVASVAALQTHHFAPAVRALIAVTPAIPMFAVIAAVICFMLSIDELQRQMHLEALAVAAGVTAALGITYTFLEGAGLPHSQALPFIRRRYA